MYRNFTKPATAIRENMHERQLQTNGHVVSSPEEYDTRVQPQEHDVSQVEAYSHPYGGHPGYNTNGLPHYIPADGQVNHLQQIHPAYQHPQQNGQIMQIQASSAANGHVNNMAAKGGYTTSIYVGGPGVVQPTSANVVQNSHQTQHPYSSHSSHPATSGYGYHSQHASSAGHAENQVQEYHNLQRDLANLHLHQAYSSQHTPHHNAVYPQHNYNYNYGHHPAYQSGSNHYLPQTTIASRYGVPLTNIDEVNVAEFPNSPSNYHNSSYCVPNVHPTHSAPRQNMWSIPENAEESETSAENTLPSPNTNHDHCISPSQSAGQSHPSKQTLSDVKEVSRDGNSSSLSASTNPLIQSRGFTQTQYNVIPKPPPLLEAIFAGRRDVRNPSLVHEKQIVSEKGTVRGFKNRVRAGIATFWAEPADPRNFRQLEQGKIIVYATSMSVVRETSERCKVVRNLLQNHMVRYEERDLYMSREIQHELKHRLAQESAQEVRLPHVFADGIHIGGSEELEKMNEAGELRGLLDNYQKITVRIMCEKCGGYRFVPCDICHGSKRSLIRNHFTEEFCALRCMHCNESGLKRCDMCLDQQE